MKLREFVVFRMGRGWLYKLDQALRAGNVDAAKRWERAVVEVVEGHAFKEWPLPGEPL